MPCKPILQLSPQQIGIFLGVRLSLSLLPGARLEVNRSILSECFVPSDLGLQRRNSVVALREAFFAAIKCFPDAGNFRI